jgi:hypothetical protein
MTDTPNLGLPYLDGAQAQKHVTHNEALRILDAAVQIAVRDATRTVPPGAPANGARYVVAAPAGGAWAGWDHAIATWQDGAWTLLAPRQGWCVWSVADDALLVFDGALWRAVGTPPLDNIAHLGINATATAPNLLSVASNAALIAAIAALDGGSGDVRLQLSKESAARTASVLFADDFSGRAEFGLVGGDAFKLKVSPDGATWTEAVVVDQATGNTTLPRGLALSGVAAPAMLTASVNDYNPAGLGGAAVLQVSADAPRSISGLAGGAAGRVMTVINVGSQPVTLLDEAAASSAANRFGLGGALGLDARQAAILRYDGSAARWLAIASAAGPQASGRNYLINPSGEINQAGVGSQADASYDFDQWLTLTQTAAVTVSQLADAENATPFMMRALQPSVTAQRFGRMQWLEKLACRELRGQPVTLSARVRLSAAATLRTAIVEWQGAADAIAKDVVADWTSASLTPGGFFTATSTAVVAVGATALAAGTLTDIASLTGTVSSAMNNLAVLFWTDAAQPQNVTLDIARVKLERGGAATRYVAPAFDDELRRCQRYYRKSYDYAVVPGTAGASNGAHEMYVTAGIGAYQMPGAKFDRMMKLPVTTIYSVNTGAFGNVTAVGAGGDKTISSEMEGECGHSHFISLTAADLIRWQYRCVARL